MILQCSSLVERRLSGEPLQYIVGTSEFLGCSFIVNRDVFIPRPETELLVKEVLSSTDNRDGLRILDLCTGCGNIAVSLARSADKIEVVAVDISHSAIKAAEENAIVHEADKKIRFYTGDLFTALPIEKKYKFDIIVCNPPYIKSSELQFLQQEVRREPKVALDGGMDGLEFYRRIAHEVPHYLRKGGALFLEIGFAQKDDVVNIFSSKEMFNAYEVKKDFLGIERVILWTSLL